MTGRSLALLLGVTYALITLLELVAGDLTAGSLTLLERTTRGNLLHWAAALVALGGFFAGERVSRSADAVLGCVLLALAVWGLLSPASLGTALGYREGIPAVYQVFHGATAVIALAGAFLLRRQAARAG